MTRRILVADAEHIGEVAGSILLGSMTDCLAKTGHVRLAVAGGRGPVPVFRWFRAHLPQDVVSRCTLTWVDERHLDIVGDDWRAWPADSNRRSTWEHWLAHIDPRPAEVVLDGPGGLPAARAHVEAVFRAQLGGIDVALLGVGEDGHIASLFPGHAAWEATTTVVAVNDAPKPPSERLTLSRPVLEQAFCVVVATGSGKASAISRAYRGELPLGRLSPLESVWVLDATAAAELPPGATTPCVP